MRTSVKSQEARLAQILRAWQHIESRSMTKTEEIIQRTRNPVIKMVMEIIRCDSAVHHRVEQFLIDSLETQAVTLSVDDLTQVWDAIEAHIEAEAATAELVADARKALVGTKDVVQQFLLGYLARDEEKHDRLLDDLQLIKRGMYRSA